MRKVNSINYLAIYIIEQLGNDKPSQYQIDMAEILLNAIKKIASTPTHHSCNISDPLKSTDKE